MVLTSKKEPRYNTQETEYSECKVLVFEPQHYFEIILKISKIEPWLFAQTMFKHSPGSAYIFADVISLLFTHSYLYNHDRTEDVGLNRIHSTSEVCVHKTVMV